MPSAFDVPTFLPGSPGPFATLAVSNAAVTLPRKTIAHYVICQCTVANIRMTLDGSTPTANIGIQWQPGDIFSLVGFFSMAGAMFIRETGVDAVLQIQPFAITPESVAEIRAALEVSEMPVLG